MIDQMQETIERLEAQNAQFALFVIEFKNALAARDARMAELEGLPKQLRGLHLDSCGCRGCRIIDAALKGVSRD